MSYVVAVLGNLDVLNETHWADTISHEHRRRLHQAAKEIHGKRLSPKAAVQSFKGTGLPLDQVAHYLRHRVHYLGHHHI